MWTSYEPQWTTCEVQCTIYVPDCVSYHGAALKFLSQICPRQTCFLCAVCSNTIHLMRSFLKWQNSRQQEHVVLKNSIYTHKGLHFWPEHDSTGLSVALSWHQVLRQILGLFAFQSQGGNSSTTLSSASTVALNVSLNGLNVPPSGKSKTCRSLFWHHHKWHTTFFNVPYIWQAVRLARGNVA